MTDTILVTGGAGFVGGHLLDVLTGHPTTTVGPAVHSSPRVIAWHRPGHPPQRGGQGVSWVPVDLLDRAGVFEAVASTRPTLVYHCAGAAHVGQAWNRTEATFSVNVRGTHHLLQALEQAGTTTRVLIPSSSLVYRPAEVALTEERELVPATPYGLSKLAQELVGLSAMTPRLRVYVPRAFTHIGPRQDPDFSVSSFARQIAQIEAGRKPPQIQVGNLDAKRDLTDVRDTVRAYGLIVDHGAPGRFYNVCSGQAVAMSQVLDLLLARAHRSIEVVVDRNRLRPADAPIVLGDFSRMSRELGWAPRIPLDQSLSDILEYWRGRSS